MKRSTETRLFGTDGIRERVGNFPLDKNSLLRLGQTLGEIFKNSRILIGRDTRQSGEEIENIIVSGISNSAEIFSCGIIPTPGLSYITDHSDFDLGIMITASHNPYQDNGIKIFKHNGEKITEKLEQNIEEAFFSSKKMHATDQGNKIAKPEIKEVYSSFLQDHAKELKGRKLKMIVDCANGATYEIAPEILRKTDINVSFINSNPNGKNINLNSGSTHPQSLKKKS